jgi:hypothetical protein
MRKRRKKFVVTKSGRKKNVYDSIRHLNAPGEQAESQKKKYNRSQEKRDMLDELEEYAEYLK